MNWKDWCNVCVYVFICGCITLTQVIAYVLRAQAHIHIAAKDIYVGCGCNFKSETTSLHGLLVPVSISFTISGIMKWTWKCSYSQCHNCWSSATGKLYISIWMSRFIDEIYIHLFVGQRNHSSSSKRLQ